IRSYAAEADRRILDAFANRDVENDENPVLRHSLAVRTVLEHEDMHQETLQYILHRLDYAQKVRPDGRTAARVSGEPPQPRRVRIPAGAATVGAVRDEAEFAWDNELDAHVVDVPAFSIDVCSVTNRDFLEFIESGGYANDSLWDEEGLAWIRSHTVRHPLFWEERRGSWFWRGMWDLIPL